MKRWMITLGFQNPDAEMMALIPAERAHVQELMQQGVLQAIYIAADNSKVWLVMNGETQAAIEETLSHFPMYKYFVTQINAIN